VKTGKRARGSQSRLSVSIADTLRQGTDRGPRFAAAPLAGALRVPGHTRSRATTHHCCADLYTDAGPFSPVSSLLVAAKGGGGVLVCGRDAGCPAPPAQIRARGITTLGSCLRSKDSVRLPYASSRTVHGIPTQRSGRVLLARIPLGPPPSLHPLRARRSAFPRRFRFPLARLQRFRLRARLGPPWLRSPASSALCSGTSSVLLGSQTPCSVHRCRAPVGFTSRPTLPVGGRRVSRFSRIVSPRMLRVFDRARPQRTSPCRCVGYCLRHWKKPRPLGLQLDFAAQYLACVCLG